MKKRRIGLSVLFFIGSFIISGGLFIVSTQAAEFSLVHATINPPTHIDYPVNSDFVERVKKLSNGRIDFKVYHSGVLGDENEMLSQIQTGTISTARLTGSPLGSISDGYMIINLPFLFAHPKHMLTSVRSDKFAKLTEDELLAEGVRPLEFWWMGVRDVYTKKPVKNLEDIQGMKLRTWQDKYVVKSWKTLGAIPTPISFNELYTALQTGVVDGGEGWAASYNARKFYESTPNLTKIGYINIVSALVISEKTWQELPPELQDVVKQAAQENAEFAYETFKKQNDEIYDTAVTNGATVMDVSDIEKWQEKVQPLYKEFGDEYGQAYGDFINWVIETR